MKYCLNFDNKSKYINEVAEVRINYDKQKLEAFEYIKQHTNQMIILFTEELNDNIINHFNKIAKENKDFNFKVEFAKFNNDYIEKLKNVDFNFFFKIYTKDWDTLLGLVECGVSDIYVTENLGFELNKIAEILHSKNINVRCFPNISQTSWKNNQNRLKTFFIRPEDVKEYELYVDVLEFIGVWDNNARIDTYYEIYAKDKKWFGNLKELIIDLDIDLDSRYIIKEFAKKRTRCAKECLKGKPCVICDRIVDLSKNLEQAGLIIEVNKEEKNNG